MTRTRGIHIAATLAMIILAAAPFFQTLGFDLVWDDAALISRIASVADTQGIKGLFVSDFRLSADADLGYYRPVTTSSVWLQTASAWRRGDDTARARAARSRWLWEVCLHFSACLRKSRCSCFRAFWWCGRCCPMRTRSRRGGNAI